MTSRFASTSAAGVRVPTFAGVMLVAAHWCSSIRNTDTERLGHDRSWPLDQPPHLGALHEPGGLP